MNDRAADDLDWPRFAGTLRFDESARREAAEDFGHLRHASPRAVLVPADVDDVARLVRFAAESRIDVAARGQGHAMGGQPLAPGGVVVDMRGLAAIEAPEGESIRVGAGAIWADVVQRALSQGLVPPALTDFLGLSVGGTLSVGGIGGQAFRFGAQIDNVLELDVVTGAGEIVRCSPTASPDLFAACLGGLGQHAIITHVRLRLVPARPRVRTYEALYADASTFLDLQMACCETGRFDYVAGMIVPAPTGFAYLVQASIFAADVASVDDASARALFSPAPLSLNVLDRDTFAFLDRSSAQMTALKEAGIWGVPHPWITQFLPRSASARFVERLVSDVTVDAIGEGYIAVYPLKRAAVRAATLPLPPDDDIFLIGLLPNVLPASPERTAMLVGLGRALYEHGRALGSKLYPIGLLPRGDEWPAHYGPGWETLCADKRRFDPAGILAPGPGFDFGIGR